MILHWGQVDPVDQPSLSPYNGMGNNPILNSDVLGNTVENDYKINKKGEITLLKKTNDDFDRLIVVQGKKEKIRYNRKGKLKNKSIEIKDRVGDTEKERKVLSNRYARDDSYKDENGEVTDLVGLKIDFGQNNEKEATRIFEFVTSNTSVEWSQVTYGKMGDFINTSLFVTHNSERDMEVFGQKEAFIYANARGINIIKHTHNHPNNNPLPSGTNEASFGELTGDKAAKAATFNSLIPKLRTENKRDVIKN